jgi:hypothetical protein
MVQRCQEVQARDLVFIEGGKAFAGLDVLLDPPPHAGHPHERGDRHRVGCPAPVEGQLTGAQVASDQQPMLTGMIGFVDVDQGPPVPAAPQGGSKARIPRSRALISTPLGSKVRK